MGLELNGLMLICLLKDREEKLIAVASNLQVHSYSVSSLFLINSKQRCVSYDVEFFA